MLEKYSRPISLSDPCGDFSEEELKDILDTPDEKMAFFEFACLFQCVLPAGTYEEVMYFFPMALNYVLEEKEEWNSLFTDFFIWVQDNEQNLRKDAVWDYIWAKTNARSEAKINNRFLLRRWIDTRHNSFFYPKGYDWFLAIDDVIGFSYNIFRLPCQFVPNMEKIFLQWFEKIDDYDTAAWFIYLEIMCEHIPVLKQLAQEETRKERALHLIREHMKKNELHLRFWERELSYKRGNYANIRINHI